MSLEDLKTACLQAGESEIFVYLRLLDMLGFVPVVALQKMHAR